MCRLKRPLLTLDFLNIFERSSHTSIWMYSDVLQIYVIVENSLNLHYTNIQSKAILKCCPHILKNKPVSYRFFELIARNGAKSPECIYFIFSVVFSRFFISFCDNISSGATGSSVSSHFSRKSRKRRIFFTFSRFL